MILNHKYSIKFVLIETVLNDIPGILVGWNSKIWIQDYLILVIDKLMVNSLSQQIFGLISQNLD